MARLTPEQMEQQRQQQNIYATVIMQGHGWNATVPQDPADQDLVVSEDQVMQSAAGFYIGSLCYIYEANDPYNGEWSGPFPYCRDTPYMSEADANDYLAYINL